MALSRSLPGLIIAYFLMRIVILLAGFQGASHIWVYGKRRLE